MKIKITALSRHISLGDPMVVYRQEIQWDDADDGKGRWSDLGCRTDRHENFGLLVYTLAAGSRRLGISFIYEDWTVRFGQSQEGIDVRTLEDKIMDSLKDFINV